MLGRVPVLFAVAAFAAALAGCDLGRDQIVTVEIAGVGLDTDRRRVVETLKSMTEGPGQYLTSVASGDSMTVRLSPVDDVDGFSRRIPFGKVTKIDGRTVKVDFLPAR